jgi:NAD(P)-dependent dehydrogenase (short-subunit alcohol dehydrogenase family)
MRLDEKVAVVTGGAGGLGRATCELLSAEGARVLVVDIDEEGARATAEAIGGAFLQADVSLLDENRTMVATAIERFGRLDILHLNAGLTTGFGVDESFDPERYRAVMGVNLDGVVFGTHAALPHMRKGGVIVATASLAGLTGVPFDPLYAANKHAVVGLARSLGPALEGRGIRFNALCPGFAESRMTESIRDGLAQAGIPLIPARAVAEAVVKLVTGDMTGECWFVQAGREAAAFEFRGLPGPRLDMA